MLEACYSKYLLHFKNPSGTSRGTLTDKETFFVKIRDTENPSCWGIGECALFRGLSADDRPGYEDKLQEVCRNINQPDWSALSDWSSIRFGVETALRDLAQGGKRILFSSDFTNGKQGIEINGLIWMGDRATMQRRIEEKLEAGFRCIKLKIGAIDFEAELLLLRTIRQRYSRDDIELRVDANGAFSAANAISRLESLARYELHSIEQPIRQGQWEAMAELCRNTPIPIALDEELIGVNGVEQKSALLDAINPQYIVLKPALVGGFGGAEEWIRLAEDRKTGWWITSALESDIGLNALAQWTATLNNPMPQGLGTGQLFTNNITSPLRQQGKQLYHDPSAGWEIPPLCSFL